MGKIMNFGFLMLRSALKNYSVLEMKAGVLDFLLN